MFIDVFTSSSKLPRVAAAASNYYIIKNIGVIMRKLAIGFVCVIFLVSCTSTHKETGLKSAVKTRVEVENQKFLDVTIFVLRGSQRIRLGMVPALTTRSFVIPENLVVNVKALRFLADPVGSSQRSVSQEILVMPGETVELVIFK